MSVSRSFFDDFHVAFGHSAEADAFATTTGTSDVVNMKNFHSVAFLVHWGVGTTGTIKITVEACDDVVPSNVTAIPVRYRLITGAIDAGDTSGAITAATASGGYTTTAGSHQIVIVEADASELGDTGYGYVRCKITEVVDDPILGGVIILQGKPRFDTDDSTLT
jgi:hypothetical protein